MNVGFIGLGRVGLSIALALERHGGHKVIGYDVSPMPEQILACKVRPPAEEGIHFLLAAHDIVIADSAEDVVDNCDLIMVCVQTPHPAGWTGDAPMRAPCDFDYSHLTDAVSAIGKAAAGQQRHITLVIVSTVLPGTCERELVPLLPPNVHLVYAPSLISLGTVVKDFLEPEVVIIGCQDPAYADPYVNALPIAEAVPVCVCSLPSAELAKMSYNLLTVAKLAVSGTVARLAEQCGADSDVVTEVLSHGTNRLLSPMYLKAGMPAAGPCHPRDVNALAWLAGPDGPSLPLALAADREEHAWWLAGIVRREHERTRLPVMLIGASYKPGTSVDAGSASVLVAGFLHDLTGRIFNAPGRMPEDIGPHVFFIGCAEPHFAAFEYPPGSVVIDPHGYIPSRPGVVLITPGRKSGGA